MFNPTATYRLQFHKDFTFKDFENVFSYLKKLGVSTIYASPIFESVHGSTHGYDGLNPHKINPEIGTLEELQAIHKRLVKETMGWLQDIVPNHMAFDTRNPWLKDVLEKGSRSAWASFFDINWNSNVHDGKLMVPFLGASLEEIIAKNELFLSLQDNYVAFKYHNTLYPVNEVVYKELLQRIQDKVNVSSLVEQLNELNNHEAGYSKKFEDFKTSFSSELDREVLEVLLSKINNDKNELLHLAQGQYYHLCHWQVTDKHINYRRFFTVNGLICLNIQDESIFGYFHQFIKSLVDEGVFQGLRIDHIDGLFDPEEYLERLKVLMGVHVYVTVEKILQPNENIPASWKTEGNTGYDFLAIVNNLFTNKKHERLVSEFYSSLVPSGNNFIQQLREKKAYILYGHMAGELENLVDLFFAQDLFNEDEAKHIQKDLLKKAIGEWLVYCPVYRYYGNRMPLPSEETKTTHELFQEIKQAEPELEKAVDLLRYVLFEKVHQGIEGYNQRALHFYQRCMQFSGPLMAKGFEDTLMYTYNCFIAHNEVGDSPATFGYTIEEFHQKMKKRQKHYPLSINTTATHDTKRGEDVRARLNVLSDIAPQWCRQAKEWIQINKEYIKGGITVNDEYFIYQTLIGHYPMPGEDEDDFENRLQEYLQKALREAKLNSNWANPNDEYENAIKNFALYLLDKNKPFWNSFQNFYADIVDFGILNSLVQLLLKFTCPGVPDVYQGGELWDLSFVDPDNRRAVNYTKRIELLNELEADQKSSFDKLWEQRYSGKIKLWLTQQLFELRKRYSSLFSEGEYLPITVKGKYRNNIIAFARKYRQHIIIVIAPIHLAELSIGQNRKWQEIHWLDTRIELPENILPTADSLFDRKKIPLVKGLSIKNIFRQFPFVIIKGEVIPNQRGAGVLLHISSLPSQFGIGDMGPEAKSFADYLYNSYQKYWQLLPLNPTEGGQGHSPYSSTSSRAGNILLISPELLVEEGLLNNDDLESFYVPNTGKTDYAAAEKAKKKILDLAWVDFKTLSSEQNDFKLFCEKEKEWLNDFSLYMILKERFEGKPWYDWPNAFKFRNEDALEKLKKESGDHFKKTQWQQYIFFKQWHSLKKYCNEKSIDLIGDMPFYVSYDSADVWANKEIFDLDEDGNRIGVAGVPPDAFSEDGQLWGMPVFHWDVLRNDSYRWWIERLKKNIELFDIVRLDHFRAFSAYWKVSAKEKTAKKGKWVKGPGAHFFKAVKQNFGELPFIAEDLGEIDEPVYKLRDQFRLPGMKVLQFAFGEDMGVSLHTPHNYRENFIVYTGTHDNNTTRGWWRQDAVASHEYVAQYHGRSLNEDEVSHLLCRMAYGSTARIAIIPMQDILGLGETARMNNPAGGENNWQWRLLPGQIDLDSKNMLKEWTKIYNRF